MSARRPFPLPTRPFPPRWIIPSVDRRYPFTQDRRALISVGVLALVVGGAIFAPWLTPYSPIAVDPAHQFSSPGLTHLFGTDLFGRDVLSRVLYGGRISLLTGVAAVLIACVPGTILGLLAGYFAHTVDVVIMRVTDMMLSFPGILLALAIVAMLGPGLSHAIIAVGISGIPGYTRLVRGNVLVLRRVLFVRAARSVGASDWRIVTRHIFPNILGSLIVFITVDVAWAILNASSLSFLGLGVQQPTAEWGALLSEGRGYLYEAPWTTVAPGLVLMISILCINLLGDSLRDLLDPRRRSQPRG
jgi:ABC-type dipeptide/oligopeptide/nickel transport system permease subunit